MIGNVVEIKNNGPAESFLLRRRILIREFVFFGPFGTFSSIRESFFSTKFVQETAKGKSLRPKFRVYFWYTKVSALKVNQHSICNAIYSQKYFALLFLYFCRLGSKHT